MRERCAARYAPAVNGIPLHTAHLVQRLFGDYCARVCPPTARQSVQLGFRLEPDRVTLHEVRAFCGVPGASHYVDVAQFRFAARPAEWRLYHLDEHRQWRRYAPRRASRSPLELLRELDADPLGLFWGRVDGKSLRWCSARGRCEGCDVEYCRILGLSSHRHIPRL
jgi:hypothetical protein